MNKIKNPYESKRAWEWDLVKGAQRIYNMWTQNLDAMVFCWERLAGNQHGGVRGN